MPTDFIPLLRQLNQYLEQRGQVQMQPLGLSTSEGLTLCYLLRHKGGRSLRSTAARTTGSIQGRPVRHAQVAVPQRVSGDGSLSR